MFTKAFSEVYGFSVIALRYYNVFGKRQDPKSQYAAAIPVFVSRLLKGESITIYGDGEQTRDFVFIDNVVQANIKAALDAGDDSSGRVFNIGCGKSVTINGLYAIISQELGINVEPIYDSPRAGDVRDSLADISAARKAFGYNPEIDVEEGLKRSIKWYRENYV
jgi:nucleoside-diphosphate-sugar epimerase